MTNNIGYLRDELVKLFGSIRDNEVKPATAKEMTNAAGKAISAAKLELEYQREKHRQPKLLLPFLERVRKSK